MSGIASISGRLGNYCFRTMKKSGKVYIHQMPSKKSGTSKAPSAATLARRERFAAIAKMVQQMQMRSAQGVKCPYCGDETGWYNPISNRFQTDLKNNQREHCPKCGKRVYAREGWLMNQPPFKEDEDDGKRT